MFRCFVCDRQTKINAMVPVSKEEEKFDRVINFYALVHCIGDPDQFDENENVVLCEQCVTEALGFEHSEADARIVEVMLDEMDIIDPKEREKSRIYIKVLSSVPHPENDTVTITTATWSDTWKTVVYVWVTYRDIEDGKIVGGNVELACKSEGV